MATLGAVYDAQPAPRRPHDVIAVPGGRTGDRTPRPGPHATGTWLCGSVVHDAQHVIGQVFDHAEARDPDHSRTWVVLVDGARHQLDLIGAEAARRNISVHVVIDIVHVLERIWDAAWCLHQTGDPAAEDWVAAHALTILAGRTTQAAAAIDAQATIAGLPRDQRSGLDTCLRYLNNNTQYVRYDQALEQGWPIATGVIEGAARHLLADRLEITGARWGLAGAESIFETPRHDLERRP